MGASTCRYSTWSETCLPLRGPSHQTSLARGAVEKFAVYWSWMSLLFLIRCVLVPFGALFAAFAAMMGHPQTAVVLLALCVFGLNGLFGGILPAVLLFLSPYPFDGVLAIVTGTAAVLLSFNIIFCERYAVLYVLPMACTVTAIMAFIDGIVTNSPFVYGFLHKEFAMLTFSLLAISGYRYWVFRSSWKAITPDKIKYDIVWKGIYSRVDSEEKLERLKTMLLCIAVHHSPQQMIQNEVGVDVPVTLLDVLFLQATLVEPLLVDRVTSWAQSSCGYFGRKKRINSEQRPLATSPSTLGNHLGAQPEVVHSPTAGLVMWGDVLHDETSSHLIQWAAPKGIERSIEKVSRSYANDVSKVIDIARQAIIFKSFHDLIVCLESILSDTSVSVLRIKNRFDGDALCVAGYRDVNVNMVIVSEESRRLGVAGHVCEVQLVLSDFWNLKSKDGHRRYVEFRNRLAQ